MIAVYILSGIVGIIFLHFLFLFILTLFVKNKDYDKINGLYRAVFVFHCRIARFVSRIKICVTGKEKLGGLTGKFLLVGNHRSNYDPFMTVVGLKIKDIAFISKPENFKVPLFGKISRKCGYFAIDRENPKNALKAINRAADLIKNGVTSVGVYPEGTRSKTGELLPFHDGVFKIASKAACPIVVVAIRGTEKVHKNYPWHRTTVYIDVLEVIDAERVKALTSHEISDTVRESLAAATQGK